MGGAVARAALRIATGMVLLFIYLPLGYILSIGFWAKPLVNNATIFSAKKESQAQAAAG